MRLISFQLDGYRRFAHGGELRLDCGLVAILGPNEAGKTSVLRAMQHLGHDRPFTTQGSSQEITRVRDISPNAVVLSALFLIEAIDRSRISDFEEASGARWLQVRKLANGSRQYELLPSVVRDRTIRNQLLHRLIDRSRLAQEELSKEENLSSMIDAAIDILGRDTETLTGKQLEELSKLAEIFSISSSSDDQQIALEIKDVAAHEGRPHPSSAASQLESSVPAFLIFSEADRDLQPSYELSAFFADKKKNRVAEAVPIALQNLLFTAAVDHTDLYSAAQAGDHGRIEQILFSANEILRQKLDVWSQSRISLRLRLNGTNLILLVGDPSSRMDAISERSDGLRQFLALLAFLNRANALDRKPILLIDEAELHLHYDAQADLVQMLAKQQLVQKVIYTTHSIGCLPEDFGGGLIFVRPVGDESTIQNKFWSSEIGGLSALLTGMGAAAAAFLPLRYCLLTEGPVDFLLLPRLFKEAAGVDFLGFQIVPGLAQASDDQLVMLLGNAKRVMCLVDGDEAGDSIVQRLTRKGMSTRKMVRLNDVADCAVVEDLVNPHLLLAALNEELTRSGHERVSDGLPLKGRARAMEKLCEVGNRRIPNKVDLAYRILDRHDDPIFDPERQEAIRSLLERITTGFQED